ncbi:hypothetical protein AVEN_77476-1 [Araneus ventricosus]|uniref:Uncharacterized protein n=1 Tax=Araneus ventricosus TaxID=182803 RepID=A0A4Y2NFF8_ARAVE|nr:hypothetical protein AVEN_77476-1 [Araneus ventricosus]
MNVVLQEVFQAILLLAIRSVFSFDSNTPDSDVLEVGFDYIYKSVEDSPTELGTEPENNNNSIKYALYTPSNPKEACYIEPTHEEFDYCRFNSSYKTQFMIHGFAEILKPGNQFDVRYPFQ